MKDSQGNEFGIKDTLGSSEGIPPCPTIQCQDIKFMASGGIATMVRLNKQLGKRSFTMNQKDLLNSKWVKIQKD